MESPPEDPQRRRAGFTLIEIMVVIAIIGLLATLVGPYVYARLAEAKIVTTTSKMNNVVRQCVEDYRRHYSRVPDTLEELLQPSERNLGNPYLDEETLLDAWGNPFVYTRLSNSKYIITSLGADGLEGGENEDADLFVPKQKTQGR